MTEQELESLRTIIHYLWRDEQKHFDDCELNDGGAPNDHVFSHLETLNRYLTRTRAIDVSPTTPITTTADLIDPRTAR